MRQSHKVLLSLLLFCVALAAFWATSIISADDKESLTGSLVDGNTDFALKLYGELRSAEGNLFFSPYSISSAMGMTYAGARQNTAREMQKALHFQIEQAQLPAAFKLLNHELAVNVRNAAYKLSIANGLCLTGGNNLSDEFKSLLKDNYDAELFSGELNKINGWVKQKTEGKIEKILEDMEPNSVCVVLSAIYFKGTWENQFQKSNTHDAPFKVSAGKQVTVPFMYQKRDFQILKKQDFQAASIPYKGKCLSMVILLPHEADGLGKLEKQLTRDNLQQWLTELNKSPVVETEFYMPKYKLKTGYDLIPPCKALGMKEAFDISGKADFSGMGGRKGELWISQIKHKAFVEVNEEGTEAAATTAFGMTTLSMRKYQLFRADHPFLFMIRDNKTGSILFMGRMVNPAGM
jgi:serine protease inhibitor